MEVDEKPVAPPIVPPSDLASDGTPRRFDWSEDKRQLVASLKAAPWCIGAVFLLFFISPDFPHFSPEVLLVSFLLGSLAAMLIGGLLRSSRERR